MFRPNWASSGNNNCVRNTLYIILYYIILYYIILHYIILYYIILYYIILYYGTTVLYAVRRWPKRRYLAHDCTCRVIDNAIIAVLSVIKITEVGIQTCK